MDELTLKSPLEVTWPEPLLAAPRVHEPAQRFVLHQNSQFDPCRVPFLEQTSGFLKRSQSNSFAVILCSQHVLELAWFPGTTKLGD